MIAAALALLLIAGWIVSAIALIVGPYRWLKSDEPDKGIFVVFAVLGIGLGVAMLLLLVGAITGQIDIRSGLLPDGCYRVGHEFSGKTTHNTFELIEACR